jgi:hypothetical protein
MTSFIYSSKTAAPPLSQAPDTVFERRGHDDWAWWLFSASLGRFDISQSGKGDRDSCLCSLSTSLQWLLLLDLGASSVIEHPRPFFPSYLAVLIFPLPGSFYPLQPHKFRVIEKRIICNTCQVLLRSQSLPPLTSSESGYGSPFPLTASVNAVSCMLPRGNF